MSIPFLSLGGVFTQKVKNFSDFVNVNDNYQLRKAVTDFFKLVPNVDMSQIEELAKRLELPTERILVEIFNIMGDFWHAGKFSENPNQPIDENEYNMGVAVEYEHTRDFFTSEKIALDHLTEDSAYYSKLDAARL